MKINGSGIEVTKSISAHVEKAFSKIKTVFHSESSHLTFKKEGDDFEVHVGYQHGKDLVQAKSKSDDLYNAINQCAEKIKRQLIDNKER